MNQDLYFRSPGAMIWQIVLALVLANPPALAATPLMAAAVDGPAERWLGSMWIPSDGRLRSKALLHTSNTRLPQTYR